MIWAFWRGFKKRTARVSRKLGMLPPKEEARARFRLFKKKAARVSRQLGILPPKQDPQGAAGAVELAQGRAGTPGGGASAADGVADRAVEIAEAGRRRAQAANASARRSAGAQLIRKSEEPGSSDDDADHSMNQRLHENLRQSLRNMHENIRVVERRSSLHPGAKQLYTHDDVKELLEASRSLQNAVVAKIAHQAARTTPEGSDAGSRGTTDSGGAAWA